MKTKENLMLTIDRRIASALEESGTNFACSVPCSSLAGLLELISGETSIQHVPVSREEEGVGICAGAYLSGAKPVLLMQNSGLGNCVNALLSLTSLYGLGLFIVISFRGRPREESIRAQIPMGNATLPLLSLVGAKSELIETPDLISKIAELSRIAYAEGTIRAALLPPSLWRDA